MNQTQTSTKRRLFKKLKRKDDLKIAVTKSQKKEKVLVEKVVKKAKEKKISKRPQFPKISRLIPEPTFLKHSRGSFLRLKWLVVGVLIIGTLIWNGFVLRQLLETGHTWLSLLSQRQQLSNKMMLWKNITNEYPNYRDAYFAGALLAYRLGDRGQETYFLSKLQLIDPNFPLTTTLEKLGNLQSLE